MNIPYYNFYIGLTTHDGHPFPETGEALVNLLHETLARRGIPCESFTVTEALGCWKGTPERTAILLLQTHRAHEVAEELAGAFRQECVAYQYVDDLHLAYT